jgi:hypothetical protein
MLRLELPGAFEASHGLASRTGAWGTLEALGRGLLGRQHDALANDPLWALVRTLDGRAGQTPPRDIVPTGDASVWERWPATSRPTPHASAELAPSVRAVLPPELARWTASAAPRVAQWLADALALDPVDLAPSLLQRRGTIHATRTHVDLVLPLGSATLPVRRCGLDCNPGWVPALGRVVLFHYAS